MRLIFLIVLVVVSACTTVIEAPEAEEQVQGGNATAANESNATRNHSNDSAGIILIPERQRLREIRLTLDFSLLTGENCDAIEELHVKNITKVNDAWGGLQEDLDKQEKKTSKIADELRMEEQNSARWQSLKKDYDRLQEEIDEIEDELEELERLHGNMIFTLNELKEECLVLKKNVQ